MADCFLLEQCNGKDCDKSFCVRRYKIETLLKLSGLAQNDWKKLILRIDDDGTDLEAFKKLALIDNNIEDFVKKGKHVFIHSANPGNGKTSWAKRFIQSYINAIWPMCDLSCGKALFVNVPRFLMSLKDSISNKNEYAEFIKDNIYNADLVVFDDIATKTGTDYEIDKLFSFIDGRITLGKSNIYTSNLDKAGISTALGPRLASRIGMSVDIELLGKDKRSLVDPLEEY